MKSITLILGTTTALLLSLSIGKCFFRPSALKKGSMNENTELPDFDRSLRNFHPNKGE